MKIVIVGGTGNISTSIVKLLLKLNHEVICFNRGKNSGDLPAGVRLILGDRNDREVFEKAMQSEKFDVAIDMISFTKDDAASSLRAFRGVKHFIQCSTVCTFGVDFPRLPVNEDYPLNPITNYGIKKAEADQLLLEAYDKEGFPVTIIKPSTTYGPKMGMPRQVAIDYSWIDRIRKGKPLLVCDDGNSLHQFLHVDDAAKGFVGVLGKRHCMGQVYNLVRQGYTTWEEYHRTAMRILGKDVKLVGVPLSILENLEIPGFVICKNIYAHHYYFETQKIYRDVPEFRPTISLEEGMKSVFESMDLYSKIPDSDSEVWEDKIILEHG